MANSKSIGIAYSDQDIIGAQYIYSENEFGYTAAAQGTVTQLTDKSTAVTLNKSAGRIKVYARQAAHGAVLVLQLVRQTRLANQSQPGHRRRRLRPGAVSQDSRA